MFKLQHHNQPLSFDAIQELTELSGRLYCAWHCAKYGDEMLIDHKELLGAELQTIWDAIDSILEREEFYRKEAAEEMKKFEQGFAYRSPNGQVLD